MHEVLATQDEQQRQTIAIQPLQPLTAMGLDGVVLSWVNYEAELAYWLSDVLPVMEQAGLRRPYVPADVRL